MQIVYTLTVAVQDGDEDPDHAEHELVAQLRLAAQAVENRSAPLPGGGIRALVTPDGSGIGSQVTVYLSAVTL